MELNEQLSILSMEDPMTSQVSEVESSQSASQNSQTSIPLVHGQVSVNLSPADDGDGQAWMDATPNGSSRSLGRASVPYDDEDAASINESDGRAPTNLPRTRDPNDDWSESLPVMPYPGSLRRARSISLEASDFTPQTNPSSDESDFNDEVFSGDDRSDFRSSRATQFDPRSSPPAPAPLSSSDYDFGGSQLSDLRLDQNDEFHPNETGRPPDIVKDVDLGFVDTSDSVDRPCDERSLSVARDSIRGSDPRNLPLSVGQKSKSVITDAGDQQFKRQKQTKDSEQKESRKLDSAHLPRPDKVRVDSISSSEGSDASADERLSDQLVNELLKTKKRSPQLYQQGFLPKAQLYKLINEDSVFHELSNSLSDQMTTRQILELSAGVCDESQLVVHHGKEKIKSFRKIFALLTLVEKSSSIQLFIQEDVSDLDLPLVDVTVMKRKIKKIELRRRQPGSDEPCDTRLSCFSKWTHFPTSEFYRLQWTLLAPFFSKGEDGEINDYKLKDHHVLPYVPEEYGEGDPTDRNYGDNDNSTFEGGFSVVTMVHIHPEHHNFHDPTTPERGFAIKQLKESDQLSFDKEVRILKKFNGDDKKHAHIVNLLATYTQFNKYHLVFHRAEGNLFEYWGKINPRPNFDFKQVLWLVKQCYGITNGLLQLHRHFTIEKTQAIADYDEEEKLKRTSTIGGKHVRIKAPRERIGSLPKERPAKLVRQPHKGNSVRQYGRHGDIKPENLLWYCNCTDDKGIIKISDFGTAELNSRFSKSKQRSHIANTLTYRPPECDMEPRIIRQSFDIWSLGCVFMEFVTWLLGGVELWKEFARKRMSFDIFQYHDTDTFFELVRNEGTEDVHAMVKESVTRFFDELHSHENCSDFVHDFLDMIQHNMLVVEPTNLYKTRRMCCEEVNDHLRKAFDRCKADPAYATLKNPWCKWSPRSEPLTESVEVTMTPEAKEFITHNLDRIRPHFGSPN